VSFIKNPARDSRWGLFGSLDEEMAQFVLVQPKAEAFLKAVVPLIEVLCQCDDDLRIGIGCNAGRHRSRIVAAELQSRLRRVGIDAGLVHREEQLK